MKKFLVAIMAVAAVAFTSCTPIVIKDYVTNVTNSGQNEGLYATEQFVDMYVQAIAAEQGGEAASNHIIARQQTNESKVKSGAIKGAEKAQKAILAQKTFEVREWLSEKTYTCTVSEGTEKDYNAAIKVTVDETEVLTHYYKVSK